MSLAKMKAFLFPCFIATLNWVCIVPYTSWCNKSSILLQSPYHYANSLVKVFLSNFAPIENYVLNMLIRRLISKSTFFIIAYFAIFFLCFLRELKLWNNPNRLKDSLIFNFHKSCKFHDCWCYVKLFPCTSDKSYNKLSATMP